MLNLQSGPLQVRWNIRNGFFVQDLFVVECENTSDVMAVVKEGHRNRRVGSHELNMDSSRSHSLLTLHLESESIDPDDGADGARQLVVCQYTAAILVDVVRVNSRTEAVRQIAPRRF